MLNLQADKFWSGKWSSNDQWTEQNLKNYFNKWIPHLKPSAQLFNVFDENDLAWMQNYMFREHESVTVKRTGSLLFKMEPHQTKIIVDKFYTKIRKIVPDFSDRFFESNFYVTNCPYTLHIDASEPGVCLDQFEGSIMPYRQLVIPIYIRKPEFADTTEGGIVTFQQRSLRFGTIFCQGHNADSVKGSWQDIYCHNNLEFFHLERGSEKYDPNKKFDTTFYQKYMTAKDNAWDTMPFPYDNLTSLDVEGLYSYKPGSCIVIDACQIHGSVNFLKSSGVLVKCGLALNLFKDI